VGHHVVAVAVGRRTPAATHPVEPAAHESDVPQVAVARAIAAELYDRHDWPTAADLKHDADFARAVALVAGDPVSEERTLADDPSEIVACIGLAALAGRPDLPPDWPETALRRLVGSKLADEHFLLATVAERPERLLGLVLERSQQVTTPELADFIARRMARGEPVDRATFDGHVAAPVAERIDELLANPGVRVPPAFRARSGRLGGAQT
jgi:hypothetical protein